MVLWRSYANGMASETDEQLSFIIKAYAATDMGFDGASGALRILITSSM